MGTEGVKWTLHELRLLVEFSEISFALIYVCYLGNIIISFEHSLPRISVNLTSKECTWLCKKWKLIFVVAIASNWRFIGCSLKCSNGVNVQKSWALLIHYLGMTQWCHAEAFVTWINEMNNYYFSFQEQYFLIPLRIKWLNAKQKRVNTFKGRTFLQHVNRVSRTFQHALWLWILEKKDIGYKLWALLSVVEESVNFIWQNDVSQLQTNWKKMKNNEQTEE